MKNINLFYLLIVLSCILGGCTAEGLTGPEGPTGQSGAKGETGAVGPAGKDGSIMYSGVGVPGMSIGVAGDYYLDKATGSLYGPKVVAGWGAPIVLVGAQGAAGATGANGVNGAAGATGATGVAGVTGATGANGSNGANGTNGTNGTNGSNGANGADGAAGATGAVGATGSTGAAGATGATGAAGAQGQSGTRTLSGTTSPASSTGSIGDYYLDKTTYQLYGPKNSDGWGVPVLLRGAAGPQGPSGLPGADGTVIYGGDYNPDPALGKIGDFYFGRFVATMFGPKTAAGWGSGTVLRGPAGQNGADGSKILIGLGAPDVDTGNQGDFYLDKQTFRLYGPKNVDGWGSGTSLKGADGNANVTALETADGLSFSWAYENSIRVLRKQLGFGNDTSSVFNLPAAHVAAAKNGIVMVYIGKDEGDGSYSWKQLNYTDYMMGTNVHYKYALRVNADNAKIRIFHDAQIDYSPLQVNKVRIVITPASSTEVLSTSKNGNSTLLKTMQRLNLRDSDFKKF